jgi:hypothetical protein
MPRGTTSGNSTVAIRFDMPDGAIILIETTMALFLTAADAMRGFEDRDKANGALAEPVDTRLDIILPGDEGFRFKP